MKNAKKNNKGFSLVELIVVVLIMAIIAVALAPQVLKWVDNSRIATDRQTVDSVVSFAELALTNKEAKKASEAAQYTIELDDDGYEIKVGGSAATDGDAFVKAFCDNAGIAQKASGKTIKFKSEKTATVTVATTGIVTSTSTLVSSDLD